jgi:hypothetical protein
MRENRGKLSTENLGNSHMTKAQQKFFHILDKNGHIDKQGMVLSQNPDRITVEFFSWLDGLPNGQKTFDQDAITTWRFYESEAAWQHAGNKVFA